MRPPLAPHPLREDHERIRVAQLVSRYRRRAASERLRLYRQHLQVSVTAATPLLQRVAEEPSVDVRAALHRLRPPHGWPDVPPLGSWTSVAQVLRHYDRHGATVDRHDRSRSVALCEGRHPLGRLILHVVGARLELTSRIGDVVVKTDGEAIQIVLPFHLPDTIDEALAGRPLNCLVGHRWFKSEGWTIVRVERPAGARRPRTIVRVDTGLEPYVMPWRRLVARL